GRDLPAGCRLGGLKACPPPSSNQALPTRSGTWQLLWPENFVGLLVAVLLLVVAFILWLLVVWLLVVWLLVFWFLVLGFLIGLLLFGGGCGRFPDLGINQGDCLELGGKILIFVLGRDLLQGLDHRHAHAGGPVLSSYLDQCGGRILAANLAKCLR